ncbi:MAG: hypothetical protein J2P57_12330, partial [Acidimicrobiaceae bacterium]|nr:hypothetical protein [Acidimicrobiaceae bacterium]
VIGVLESGSRGATLGIAVGPAILALLMPKRRAATLAVAAVSVAFTVTLGVFGGLGLISVQRLTGQVSVQGANDARIGALTQSLNDFVGSPIIGNGYGYVRDAHDIYLQAAAAGGAFGLIGFVLLLGAIVHSGVRSTFRTDLPFRLRILAAGLVGSLVTWLAVGIVENQIYDRYLYWPAGLLLAVRFLASRVSQTEDDTTASDSAPEDGLARGDVGLQLADRKGL